MAITRVQRCVVLCTLACLMAAPGALLADDRTKAQDTAPPAQAHEQAALEVETRRLRALQTDLIAEQKAIYRAIVVLMQRKVEFLRQDRNTLSVYDSELQFAHATAKTVHNQMLRLRQQHDDVKLEANAFAQQRQTLALLTQLSKDDRSVSPDTLATLVRQDNALQAQQATLQARIDLLAKYEGLLSSYLTELRSTRSLFLRKTFFTQKTTAWSPSLVFWPFAVLLILMMAYRIPQYIVHRDTQGAVQPHWIAHIIRWLNHSAIGLLATYGIAMALGYSTMARYIGSRLLSAYSILLVGVLAHSVLLNTLQRQDRTNRSQRVHRMRRICLYSLDGLIVSVILTLFIITALQFWGTTEEGLNALLGYATTPLLTLGGTTVSFITLLKAICGIGLFVIAIRFVDRVLKQRVFPHIQLSESAQFQIRTVTRYLLLVLGVLAGFHLLGINLGAMAIFAGTIGIGIGFGLQEIAKNFISGLILLIEKPIKVGDHIDVGKLHGRVRAIKARGTVVDTRDNISVIVPNASFISEHVVNWSYSNTVVRLGVSVGVAYGSDTTLVHDVLLQQAINEPTVLKNPAPTVLFEAFGDSALQFTLLVWTNKPEEKRPLTSRLHFAIDRAFREHQITIPFPQRDLHVKHLPTSA